MNRCSGLDTLSIYDGIGDGAKLLGEFCGGHQPLPLMSSGPNMSLQLTSHTSGVEARGYSAKYYFVQSKKMSFLGGKYYILEKTEMSFQTNATKPHKSDAV